MHSESNKMRSRPVPLMTVSLALFSVMLLFVIVFSVRSMLYHTTKRGLLTPILLCYCNANVIHLEELVNVSKLVQ